MYLKFVFGFIILNIINVSDAQPRIRRIPIEISHAREAVNAAYRAMREEQNKTICTNNRTKEFKTKIDEYINIERIIRNKTVELNENTYKFITTTTCDTQWKEALNTSDIDEKIKKCFGNTVGKGIEKKDHTNILKMLFNPNMKIDPMDYSSRINALIATRLSECWEIDIPSLNTTIQSLHPSIKNQQ